MTNTRSTSVVRAPTEIEEALMTFRVRGLAIPGNLHAGIANYIDRGVEPGDFLRAVIQNNLKDSIQYCSSDFEVIKDLVCFLYNEFPSLAWGSKERYDSWRKRFK